MPGRHGAGLWRTLARFWQRDESLSLLLALLLLFAFVLPPLAPRDGPRSPLTTAIFTAVLVAGAATVLRHRRWAALSIIALCLVALPLRWIVTLANGGDLEPWSTATDALVLALLALLVLTMVLRPGAVTRHRLEGAVAAYLLLGLAWARAFEWVALRDPSAFAGAPDGGANHWTYYSLVTLTTMGYGDITPVSAAARSLATAEAFTGQIYLAILVSRLVALELQERRPEIRSGA
jgi:hypothetical protein